MSNEANKKEYKLITKDNVRDLASQYGFTQVSKEAVQLLNNHFEKVLQTLTDNTVFYLDARNKKRCQRQDAFMACEENPNIPPGSY